MSTGAPISAGLLVVGHVDPKSTHVAGDYPELFTALLAPHGIDVVPYDVVDAGRFPVSLDERDVWICSPSRSSVYDGDPWIGEVEDLIRELVATERPYVGVCFGHQLLAQALGGRVEPAATGWGVGVQPYEVVAREPWMRPNVERFRLIASHQDQVVDAPAGARVVASSDYCPVAAIAVGERAWSVQGHPEFTAPLADHLLAGRVDLIGPERVAGARESLVDPTDHDTIASWIRATVKDG